MDRKTWTVELDGMTHVVALDWTYWGGDRQVSVDGRVVHRDTRAMRWRSSQDFDLGGHRALVTTAPSRRGSAFFAIALEVDGRVVDPDPGQRAFWEAKGSPT